MRTTAALLFLAALSGISVADSPSDKLRIDHVTIAGKSLAAMEAKLAAVGLKTERGGPHTNHATEMALASFPDGSYIELMGLQSNPDPAMLDQHPWGKFIANEAGPCAWAVRPKDFTAEVARIRSQGVPVKLETGGRTRPDGVALAWESGDIGTEKKGTFFPFLIRDTTSRDKRAFPSGKPANHDATGVLRVIIGVTKLQSAIDRFHLAYPEIGQPLRQVDKKFGAELAWLPDSPVIFAQPLGSASWLEQRIQQFGEGPCAFILAARKTEKQPSYFMESRWFGRDISWFDPDKLGGWWLGVEPE